MAMDIAADSFYSRKRKELYLDKVLAHNLKTLNNPRLEQTLAYSMQLKKYKVYIKNEKIKLQANMTEFQSSEKNIRTMTKNWNHEVKYQHVDKIGENFEVKEKADHLPVQDIVNNVGLLRGNELKRTKISHVLKNSDQIETPKEPEIPLNVNLKLSKIMSRRYTSGLKFDCSYTTIMLFLAFLEEDVALYFKLRQYILFNEPI